MQEPAPKIYLFEAIRNIPLASNVELLLNENGIDHDRAQQLRLTQLLEAFNVTRFSYYVRNNKIIIHTLTVNFSVKDASSLECRFANRALHDKDLFDTALIDPNILTALQHDRILLTNLVSDRVKAFCLAKSLTSHDLCGFQCELERYLENAKFYSLLDSHRLKFGELRNFSASDCEQLLEVLKNPTVYDLIINKKLTPQDALLLEDVNHNTHADEALRAIVRLDQLGSEQPESSAQNRDSCRCITM